ncbi:MAG: sugar phosphate nucleotidyltransferase [Patescibacteria group bacterium]
MKIMIFGKGYLGNRLAERWPGAILTDVRIDDELGVSRALDEYQPDAVINTAGKTGRPNVDWCEINQTETTRSNVIGPLVLADACLKRNIYLLHIGSGCIYYGPSPDPQGWRENDFANPASFYSRTKYSADLILSKYPNVGIARIRMPIDEKPHERNLINKLAHYKQIVDVENSVTVVEDLIYAVKQLVEKKGVGIFHVVNPGSMKHRELMDLYKFYVDPNHNAEWINETDLVKRGLAIKQRSNCILQSTRLEQLGIRLRPIQIALRDTMIKYALVLHERNHNPVSSTSVTRPSNYQKREMKGVITAGGSGTRLSPLTDITNKHLLPVYNKPMILYPLKTLLDSGIKQILLITGPEYAHSFVKLLGSGAKLGCQITYRIQDQPGGIAQAVAMSKDFIGDSNFAVHLGDNIFDESFTDQIKNFDHGAVIFYKQVDNPRQYGVVEVDEYEKVKSIEEKPNNPKSNFAQTGLYLYDHTAFEILDSLKPSARGELEITDLNSEFLRRGELRAMPVNGRWFDAGTFQDLKRATEYYSQKDGIN